MSGLELTAEERKAIASLKRLAKHWPDTLWLFAGGQQGLAVMKKKDGRHAVHDDAPDGSIDPAYTVAHVDIEADGGDW